MEEIITRLWVTLVITFRTHPERKELEALFQHFPNALVNILYRDFRYTLAQRQRVAKVHMTPEQLVGKTPFELLLLKGDCMKGFASGINAGVWHSPLAFFYIVLLSRSSINTSLKKPAIPVSPFHPGFHYTQMGHAPDSPGQEGVYPSHVSRSFHS